MVFVFGIFVAPILSRLMATSWDGYDAERDHPVPNAVLIGLSLLVIFLAFPNRKNLEAQVAEGSPVKAVEFIKAQNISGPMLNEWVFGGYLLWAAPEHPVFIDGRGDVFGETGVVTDFADWALLHKDPHILLDKYGIKFCLLSRESPMVVVLPLLPGWREVYADKVAVVFVHSTPAP
jgi:hypothetical protein